jgi:alpha-ribazole phosphatase
MLILIRHTTPQIEPGICYGQSDIPIRNSNEIEISLSQIPKLNNFRVFSSPLLRCKCLAERISNETIFDNRLMELNFGDWELMPWNDIKGEKADTWFADYINTRSPNGESFTDLYNRVSSFYNEYILNSSEHTIVVTHAGVIRAFLTLINNEPLEFSFNRNVNYGEVIVVPV